MLGRPKAVQEEDLDLPGPTLSCPMSEAREASLKGKLRAVGFPIPHISGIILSKDCQASSIAVRGGYDMKDSGSGVHSHQTGMF